MHRTLLPGLFLLLAASSQAQSTYAFDADAQGWRRGNFDLATSTLSDIGAATWNPAGYIEGEDFAPYAFHISPALNGLDLSSTYGGRFTLDYSTQAASDPADAPFLVIANDVGAIYRTETFAGGGGFGTYGYNLDTTGGWRYGTTIANTAPATEAQIRSVLGSVARIGVTADVTTGLEFTRVDNVRLTAVPEPATLAALGFGALALFRRRRR